MREEPVKISAWIPATLKELIRKYVSQDTHLNESDFIRDALREKIQRDAPSLYNQLFRIQGDKEVVSHEHAYMQKTEGA